MAQFRAVIKGQRGEASRLGSKSSGIRAYVDGWNSGVSVYGGTHEDGSDSFLIYATGGSHAAQREEFIGTVTVRDGKAVFIPARTEKEGYVCFGRVECRNTITNAGTMCEECAAYFAERDKNA